MTTLEDILLFAQADKRVCPVPTRWNDLWETLPDRRRIGGGWSPSLPLILAAWWETSDSEKRERFLQHIRYADEHGVLLRVVVFLHSLPPEDWHYSQ